jgi:hypothetical protein
VISIVQYRERGRERFDQDTLTFTNPLEAVLHVVKAELAFGGQITEVSATRVVLQTRVFDTYDTSIVTGTDEELRPLLTLAYYHTQALAEHPGEIAAGAAQTAARMSGALGGCPGFLSLTAPILLGRNQIKTSLLLACGIEDPESIQQLVQQRLEDLVAAFQLQADGVCSFQEALAA